MTAQDEQISGTTLHTGMVEIYDFRRPTTLAREHSRVLEMAFETFARQWGTQLTAKIRAKTTVTSEAVLMQTYDTYVSSVPPVTAMVLCAVPGIESKAVLQFPSSVGLHWVGRMLGGSGDVREAAERSFTQIEQSLIRRLLDEALEDLQYSLGSLLPDPLTVDSIQYNSQFAQAAATTDLMIVAVFTVRVGELKATATLALPTELLLPQLGAPNPVDSSENPRQQLEEQVARTPVTVSVQLTPVPVKPNQVLHLSVGDVVSLPHPQHQPFDVTVDGQRLARAAVVRRGSRTAAKIVDTEENYR